MNSFGRLFRLNIFGESHQEEVGILLDGVPSGIKLDKEDFYTDLSRRKAGSLGTTKRVEADEPQIKSGLYNGYTTGSPVLISFKNNNTMSHDYDLFRNTPRPGHADFVLDKKYNGFNDIRGGGASSGRLTVGLVSAGVVAKKIIPDITFETKIVNLNGETDESKFEDIIKNAEKDGDSVGGIVSLKAKNVKIGLGEPYFDSFESVLSHLLFSVGGVKGVEFGIGFKGVSLKGSQFNDSFIGKCGRTKTNNNGGINGGVTNGNDIEVNVFVKPTPSIYKEQQTYNFKENTMENLLVKGRHDSAIIIRAQVVLEACLAIALADFTLIDKAYRG